MGLLLTCSGTKSDNYFAFFYFPSRCSDFTGISFFIHLLVCLFDGTKRSVVRACRGGRAGDTERLSPCKVEQTRIFRDGATPRLTTHLHNIAQYLCCARREGAFLSPPFCKLVFNGRFFIVTRVKNEGLILDYRAARK